MQVDIILNPNNKNDWIMNKTNGWIYRIQPITKAG